MIEVRAGDAVEAAARRIGVLENASPRLEAQLLLAHVLGVERVALLAHPELALSASQHQQFEALVARRAAAEPIAYLLGEREFFGRTFRVDPRALIPRPETELLVELSVSAVRRWRDRGVEPRVVELGTGSGAVAVSVALEAGCRVTATDVSWAALSLARENAERLQAHVQLAQCSLLDGVRGPIHVLLANLPYVPSGRDLPPDVKDYEPHVALFGGARGTELIERLLADAGRVLVSGAELCVELDEEEQAAPMAALARQLYPAADVSVCQDGGGYDRALRILLT